MMSFFKNFLKVRAVLPSIYFIVLLVLINSGFQFRNYWQLEHAKEEKQVAENVMKHFKGVWDHITSSDLGVRAFLALQEPNMAIPHNQVLERYEDDFAAFEQLIRDETLFQGLDLKDKVAAYREKYWEKIEEGSHIIALSKAGSLDEAKDILRKDSGADLYSNYYWPLREELFGFLNQQIAEADAVQANSIRNITLLQVVLLLFSVPLLLLIAHHLKTNEKERKQLFADLDESNRQYIFHSGEEVGGKIDEKRIFDRIMENLKKTASFIKEITEGNYDILWEGVSANKELNKDNIAGRLVEMREKMRKVRERDQLRIWSTEGHALFAEITRRHRENPQEMYTELVSQIVKYLKINQAGLFVLKQGEKINEGQKTDYLELAACYAFNRKKYLNKKIYAGDGLVGQVFLEGESMNMEEVPEDYIQITSGLGDANPKALLLVPVKYNRQVVGILELAAFKPFSDEVVKFLEEIGNILGATLISNHTTAVTHKLLKTTQEQAEELRLQEEEMRQNMEELEATQEEMRRQHRELESANQQLKQEKTALEKALTDQGKEPSSLRHV